MTTAGWTFANSSRTWAAAVRSAHAVSTPVGNAAAALRLAGEGRSVATSGRPWAASFATVAFPTRPKAPVTRTVSDTWPPSLTESVTLGPINVTLFF